MKDLRDFLEHIEDMPGIGVVRIRQELSRYLEVPTIQQKLAAQDEYPVVLAESIENSELPLVSNLLGSPDLLAAALQVAPDRMLVEYMARESKPLEPVYVSNSVAPVQEVVRSGMDVDLNELPIVHHAPGDSGAYVTVGAMVCRDPESGAHNVGIYRHEVKGPRELGAMFSPYHDAAHILRRCAEAGQRMEVAIFIGHHPAVLLGASSVGSLAGVSEYATMGGLLGEALELVEGTTVSTMVPSHAEIVIEGSIDPDNIVTDGPFAEFTGYYGGEKKVPIIDVSAITRRTDGMYHDLDPAHREHNLAGVLAMESAVMRRLREKVPGVVDVHLPPSGCTFFSAYISVSSRVEGDTRFAALVALSVHANLKYVVVVDADVDVRNEEMVMWALNTRSQFDRDMSFIPYVQGGNLDPSTYSWDRSGGGGMSTRLLVDATVKDQAAMPERIMPSPEVWDRISLADYVEK